MKISIDIEKDGITARMVNKDVNDYGLCDALDDVNEILNNLSDHLPDPDHVDEIRFVFKPKEMI